MKDRKMLKVFAFIFVSVALLMGCVFLRNQINRPGHVSAQTASVTNQNFRVTVKASTFENEKQAMDHAINISIEFLKDDTEAILYHAPPPYNISLTSLETNEHISFFSKPAIETYTHLTSSELYSDQLLLSNLPADYVPPGHYRATISSSFDYIEIPAGSFVEEKIFFESLRDIERKDFRCSMTFDVRID